MISLKYDGHGHPVGGSTITDVLNTDITSAGFVSIIVPSAGEAKTIYITTRDGEDWLLSNESNGDGYATLPSGFSINISLRANQRIFYAKGTTSTTLEVILLA